jgi:hypothetical protein
MSDDVTLIELSTRLEAAEELVDLPAGYEDICEGPLARWKHALKRKLLHQFQTAYLDVLSRQQTALNQVLLAAVQELTESVALLHQRLDALEQTSGDQGSGVKGQESGVRDQGSGVKLNF